MAVTLIVDGKKTPDADALTIREVFQSIDSGGRFTKTLSIVELIKDESHSFTLSGHPKEGWGYLEIDDGDVAWLSFPSPPLPQEEAIKLVQAYLADKNLMACGLNWEKQKRFSPAPWRNLVVIIIAFALVVFLLRLLRN